MKTLIIQSQYQKDFIKNVLIENIKGLEFFISEFENYFTIENVKRKNLEEIIDKKLELKNLLDQLNRMGDFIK